VLRILFISTYPPQECGIATYTRALVRGVEEDNGGAECTVVVPENGDFPVQARKKIVHVVRNGGPYSYAQAAKWINNSACDVVWLQHEFGLFSGKWGKDIVTLCRHLRKPLVTTLHTVMHDPEPDAREITRQLAQMSSAVMVMANTAVKILRTRYKVNPAKLFVVPHGTPDVRFVPSSQADKGEYSGHTLLSTFGLISRGKGLENAISALPAVVTEFPEVKYLVIGQTHPKVLLEEGESYRESLVKLAEDLGVSAHVEFANRYMDLQELLDYLRITDVYVTPYIGKEQIVSGALAYAVACGKAIVSTPYRYATEVLADGRGLLVDFRDRKGMAEGILTLLRNPGLKDYIETRCYAYGRSMTWQQVGAQHIQWARNVAAERRALLAKQELASLRISAPVITRSQAS